MVPWTWWPHEEVGHTDEARKEIQGLFDTQTAFDTPKPTRLLERILSIATNPGDLILDSFAGSGTTGHAVLKLNAQQTAKEQPDSKEVEQFDLALNPEKPLVAAAPRRFILVEMESAIARDVTAERVRRAAEGYVRIKGADKIALGGDFRFCELGEPLFDEDGKIRETVSFADLARHVWFTETGEPLENQEPPSPLTGEGRGGGDDAMSTDVGDSSFPRPLTPSRQGRGNIMTSPLLGNHRGTAIYLLYNGILGDKSANGGNVLTRAVLAQLPVFDGPKVIYCAGCLLGHDRLQAERIIIRQTPYEVRIS